MFDLESKKCCFFSFSPLQILILKYSLMTQIISNHNNIYYTHFQINISVRSCEEYYINYDDNLKYVKIYLFSKMNV